MKFCDKCKNILTIKKINNKYVHYCEDCDISYPIEYKILYKKTNITKLAKIKIDVQAAIYDDVTYPRIKKKCLKCKNDILKYILDEETMKNIYVCPKCHYFWY